MRVICLFVMVTTLFASPCELVWAQEKLRTHNYDGDLQCLSISSDGKRYAVGVSANDSLLVYQLEGTRIIGRFARDLGHTRAVAFSPDGKLLAFAVMGQDSEKQPYLAVRLASMDKAQPYFDLKGPRADICELSFSPSGAFLAAGQTDGAVRVWDVNSGRSVFRSSKQAGPVSLAFSRDSRALASASRDSSLFRWNTQTWNPFPESQMQAVALVACYTHDSKYLLVGTNEGKLQKWLADGQKLGQVTSIPGIAGPIELFALSGDVSRAGTVFRNMILISDVRTGKVLFRLAHSKNYKISHLAFSRNGSLLLSGATNDFANSRTEVILWNLVIK